MITRYVVEYNSPYHGHPITSVHLTLEDAAKMAQRVLDERRGEKDTCCIEKRTYPYNEEQVNAMEILERNQFENSLKSCQWNTSSYVWSEWFHTREDLDKLANGASASKEINENHKQKKSKGVER